MMSNSCLRWCSQEVSVIMFMWLQMTLKSEKNYLIKSWTNTDYFAIPIALDWDMSFKYLKSQKILLDKVSKKDNTVSKSDFHGRHFIHYLDLTFSIFVNVKHFHLNA